MDKLQELIRPVHQALISFCQHLAHLSSLQVLQPIVAQQGALQLQQDLLSLQQTANQDYVTGANSLWNRQQQ